MNEVNHVELFIELLKKKGLVRQIQFAKQLTPEVAIGEAQEIIDKMCVARTITTALSRDEELKKAYDLAANEIMLEKIVESINLKKDENFKLSPSEHLAKVMSEAILGDIFKQFKSSK